MTNSDPSYFPASLPAAALLASIIETAQDAIIVLDDHHNIILFNHTAEEMFKTPAVEAMDGPLDRFLPEGLARRHDRFINRFEERNLVRHRMGESRTTTGIRNGGEEFPIEVSLSVFISGGKPFFTAIIRDITERKRIEDELRHLSTHDALTGLYNRHYFEEELQRLERGRPPYPVTVLIADVDGLKSVNDRYGHLSGDELIQEVARALTASFRTEDLIARLGGDEFGIILHNPDRTLTTQAIQHIYDRIGSYRGRTGVSEIDLSIGVAVAREDESLTETIRRADQAMYSQKNGKQIGRGPRS